MMWLIRKSDFRISRPIDQESLVAMIEAGELLPEDEVGFSKGYWFSLREVEEVRKKLGNINLDLLLKRKRTSNEETTSTSLGKTSSITQEITPKHGTPMPPSHGAVKDQQGLTFYAVRALIWVLATLAVFLFLVIVSWLRTY